MFRILLLAPARAFWKLCKQMHRDDPAAKQDVFDQIVSNALDFFSQAVRDVPKRPKYSAIHFYAAIELILKARLVLEHWCLLVEDPRKAKMDALRSGNFKSVGLSDACERLNNILQQPLKSYVVGCFEQLRQERNKLVHFIDFTKENTAVIEELVILELKVWHYAFRLLTKDWSPHFSMYATRLRRLDTKVRRLRQYAQSKFESVSPEIKEDKSKGGVYKLCRFCGLEAAKQSVFGGPLFQLECLVCESPRSRTFTLRVKCSCGADVDYTEDGDTCNECGESFTADSLMAEFGTPFDFKNSEPTSAHCCECEVQRVVKLENQWVCLSCLTVFDEVSKCGWCGELIPGSGMDTSITGCFVCDGPDYRD